MTRLVTLFTGQWADLPLRDLLPKLKTMGYDGVELACWGDHFEVDKALESDQYVREKRELLEQHGMQCVAISNHLVGQCVADAIIDARHKGILPPRIWGDGNPEGVRQRAAEEMKNTARVAKTFGVTQVNGFTGSPIWHMLYAFPPTSAAMIEAGYREFADRWNPIIDAFDAAGVTFGLEVHPTEIAYDIVTTEQTLAAIGRRAGFGINFDPSHLHHQFVDPVLFIETFADRIYHVHVKESERNLNGRSSILGSHLGFGDARRGWDFVSPGHGGINWDKIFRALTRIGYTGPLSVEWEDSGM
ncbi:MAG: sugar phosphate isomerase/epimerase, partial [Chloroflexales bacterium]|nr:sugar phosphate isomerase/epimerase [Chloroflexales bacterium]